eukprot:6271274-Prymnesium_polylepis.1
MWSGVTPLAIAWLIEDIEASLEAREKCMQVKRAIHAGLLEYKCTAAWMLGGVQCGGQTAFCLTVYYQH